MKRTLVGVGAGIGMYFVDRWVTFSFPYEQRYDQFISTYAQIAAGLLGLLLVVLVYQYTVVRPDFLSVRNDERDLPVLLRISQFIYWDGFLFFLVFTYPMAVLLLIRFYNGMNQFCFLLQSIGFAVTFYWMCECYRQLDPFFRYLTVYKTKRLEFIALFVLVISIFVAITLRGLGIVESVYGYSILDVLTVLSVLLVVTAFVFLMGNLTFPFSIGLDYVRYKDEIEKFNSLVTAISEHPALTDPTQASEIYEIKKKWDLFLTGHSRKGTHSIDYEQFQKDIARLQCHAEKKGKSPNQAL